MMQDVKLQERRGERRRAEVRSHKGPLDKILLALKCKKIRLLEGNASLDQIVNSIHINPNQR